MDNASYYSVLLEKKKKTLQHNWRRDEIFDGMLEKREFSKLNYIISQQ